MNRAARTCRLPGFLRVIRRTLPIALLLLVLPLRAQAQNEEYTRTATAGQDAFNAGNFAEARRLWQHARSILPNPRIYRLLGRVAAEMNDHVEAVRMYRLALTAPENGNPLTDARRLEVQDVLLPQALEHVGEFTLQLQPAEAGVTIDGNPANVHEGSLLLPVGSHTLRVRSPGYRDHEQTLDVRPRAREPLRVVLERDPSQPEPPPTPGSSGGGPDLIGPAVFLGLAGVGLLTFAITGGLALAEDGEISAGCGGTSPRTCTPEQLADLRLYTALADVGWVTALVAGGVGIGWLVFSMMQGSNTEHAAVRVAPWASADGAGVTFAGEIGAL